MSERFKAVLERMVSTPWAPLHQVDALVPSDRPQRHRDHAVPIPLPERASVPERFAAQARATPERVALSTHEGSWTYAELHAHVRALADRLAAVGIGRDSVVGLFMARGPSLVVGSMAVLEAGAAFVPLDPGSPAARTRFMIADSSCSAIVHDSGSTPRLERELRLVEVSPLAPGAPSSEASGAPRSSAPVGPHDLAYIRYTSGRLASPRGSRSNTAR